MTDKTAVATAPKPAEVAEAKKTAARGLTSAEAQERLRRNGPNAVPDTSMHPLRNALSKLWAPVPWLLELSIGLQLVLGKYLEAAIIAGLLLFNAVLAFLQEGRAQATLRALRSRLALNASVLRDGSWKTVPAIELVLDDLVKLSLGGVVPADVHLIDGSVLLDQSMLTGESMPIEADAGQDTYAGVLVRRGEGTALVTATGDKTKFGRTAELVRTAHAVSSQQTAVLRIIRNLAIFNSCMIVLMGVYAYTHTMPGSEILALLLTAVLAAVPVALPATFTLAGAIGARELAKVGVLPTRLSAVDEAANIDVLCSDKTGTLTRNELSVASVYAVAPFDEAHVLGLASLASSEGGQDPVDAAVRTASARTLSNDLPKLVHFVPFDPARKTSEASAQDEQGDSLRIVKGAFTTIAALAPALESMAASARSLEKQGLRVLAVAAGVQGSLQCAGLIALSDPPRIDAAPLIAELRTLGVRTVMVTGDAAATATTVAKAVGLTGAVCPPGSLPDQLKPERFAVFAGTLPEDKDALVRAFQKGGHMVGMCGDGANDAPALRQAQVGVAVSTATDVAKSAAGLVLTTAGLGGIVAAVKEGRVTFQRILTYTLNSIIKKIVQVMLLVIGLWVTGHAVLTPILIVIVMVSGDFLAMSLTTDRVRPSQTPNTWQIGRITIAGTILGLCFLAYCTALLIYGRSVLNLDLKELQTLSAVAIVFGGQATIYVIRERTSFWGLRPTRWLIASSLADVLVISTLALRGIAMAPLPLPVLLDEFAAALTFGVLLVAVRIPLFARLSIT